MKLLCHPSMWLLGAHLDFHLRYRGRVQYAFHSVLTTASVIMTTSSIIIVLDHEN